jgi:ketosteroid isomerase-like protein
MSEENVEAVRRNFDAFNRGDLNAFVDRFTPDATVHPLEYWPDSLIRRGREEILRLMRELREPWEKPNSRAVKIVDSGDYVVAEILYRGVMKGSEDEIEWRLGMSLTFREGKVTDMSFFRTFDEALKAVGLRE